MKLQNANSLTIRLPTEDGVRSATTATSNIIADAERRPGTVRYVRSLMHGVAAPIMGYGALNALLFASYSVSKSTLDDQQISLSEVVKVFSAGTVAGLSTFFVSAPIENVKCRAQITHGEMGKSSLRVVKEVWKVEGIRGFFKGGLVTGFRDGFGYGV